MATDFPNGICQSERTSYNNISNKKHTVFDSGVRNRKGHKDTQILMVNVTVKDIDAADLENWYYEIIDGGNLPFLAPNFKIGSITTSYFNMVGSMTKTILGNGINSYSFKVKPVVYTPANLPPAPTNAFDFETRTSDLTIKDIVTGVDISLDSSSPNLPDVTLDWQNTTTFSSNNIQEKHVSVSIKNTIDKMDNISSNQIKSMVLEIKKPYSTTAFSGVKIGFIDSLNYDGWFLEFSHIDIKLKNYVGGVLESELTTDSRDLYDMVLPTNLQLIVNILDGKINVYLNNILYISGVVTTNYVNPQPNFYFNNNSSSFQINKVKLYEVVIDEPNRKIIIEDFLTRRRDRGGLLKSTYISTNNNFDNSCIKNIEDQALINFSHYNQYTNCIVMKKNEPLKVIGNFYYSNIFLDKFRYDVIYHYEGGEHYFWSISNNGGVFQAYVVRYNLSTNDFTEIGWLNNVGTYYQNVVYYYLLDNNSGDGNVYSKGNYNYNMYKVNISISGNSCEVIYLGQDSSIGDYIWNITGKNFIGSDIDWDYYILPLDKNSGNDSIMMLKTNKIDNSYEKIDLVSSLPSDFSRIYNSGMIDVYRTNGKQFLTFPYYTVSSTVSTAVMEITNFTTLTLVATFTINTTSYKHIRGIDFVNETYTAVIDTGEILSFDLLGNTYDYTTTFIQFSQKYLTTSTQIQSCIKDEEFDGEYWRSYGHGLSKSKL